MCGLAPPPRFGLSKLDLLLAALVLIWAVNYSLVKQVFGDIPPMPFNVLRFSLASAVFLAGLAWVERARRRQHSLDPMLHTAAVPTERDWRDLVWLGLIGHCGYHLFWAAGLSMTTASNSALIMGASPVVASTTAALLGHEQIRRLHWVGIVVSLAGVVVVVGRGATLGGATMAGDVLTLAAVGCWTFLTIAGSRLMVRHSPLFVSGVTTTIGTAVYVLLALPSLDDVNWSGLAPRVWTVAAFSGLLSVAAGSIIWYAVVKRVGVARASVYSNLVPLVAVFFAAYLVDEPLTPLKLTGAALVLSGVAMTRLAREAPNVALEE
jgi:drug/metabolite transporter (DMT)-like permease